MSFNQNYHPMKVITSNWTWAVKSCGGLVLSLVGNQLLFYGPGPQMLNISRL